MAWDPKIYLGFAGERTRPAAELLARVDVAAPKRVADLGCGPGNSTALLAARWPGAELEGVDNSAEMLSDARASGVKARWTEADVARWAPRVPCDVLFSNAALQWLPDHAALLPHLMKHVAEGGVFAFQVPRNFTEPCHTLIRDVAAGGAWAAKLKNVRDWWNVLEPEAYFAILEAHARSIDIWETRYVQVLDGEDAVYRWMSGTGLRPFAAALEGAEREAFLAEYKRRVAEAYPRRASGKTLYPFQRLFAVARR
ncbi:MAG TPA: trans-aconitate 2-methyltransferase [Rhizomicrobium sp.]|jgi:trans-aconitate 2-methyltransferase|nr:trans-aconitate 2-methyltransferase [Rhizomicrobium sp.]